MGPKSPFLPLFFVNYWKFFQKIFFVFFSPFPAGIAPQKPCFRKKVYTLPGVSDAFFYTYFVRKIPFRKAISRNNVLDKDGLCRYNVSVVI